MKINRNILSLTLVFASTSSFAGTTTGTVDEVFVLGFKDAVVFSLESTNQNFDQCATNSQYGISTSNEQGKVLVSALLAAKAANQEVRIHGKADNQCSIHGGAEDINYLVVK